MATIEVFSLNLSLASIALVLILTIIAFIRQQSVIAATRTAKSGTACLRLIPLVNPAIVEYDKACKKQPSIRRGSWGVILLRPTHGRINNWYARIKCGE